MLDNTDIIKGSKLMVFVGNQAVAFATNNTFNMTVNTSQVSTKSHGDYPATIPQNINWEITSENLYSYNGEKSFIDLARKKQNVTVRFADASNYATDEKGIVGHQSSSGDNDWTPGTQGVQGQAIVTSFSVNAPAGDNATMTVTFTGNGDLDYLNLPTA